MELFKRKYDLKVIRELIDNKACKFGVNAKKGAHALKYSETEATEIVRNIETKEFVKTMTEYANSATWQDVYKKEVDGKRIYIKFKVVKNKILIVTSFKKDESSNH